MIDSTVYDLAFDLKENRPVDAFLIPFYDSDSSDERFDFLEVLESPFERKRTVIKRVDNTVQVVDKFMHVWHLLTASSNACAVVDSHYKTYLVMKYSTITVTDGSFTLILPKQLVEFNTPQDFEILT